MRSNACASVTHTPLPTLDGNGNIDEVFQNLISIAIKYRRPGVAPEIHLSAREEGAVWRFSVKDNGIGIKLDDRHTIFSIFKRLHGPSIPGSGIGLALVQKIIAALGGSIWVESEPGVGSTFFFTLPRGQMWPLGGEPFGMAGGRPEHNLIAGNCFAEVHSAFKGRLPGIQ